MDNINIEELYKENLEEINGIKFTIREIDIITGVLYKRGEKKIASLLSISPRTVGTHVHNIMIKLGVNSKENIIDFVEQSNKLQYFKYYYPLLLIQANFEKQLQKIKALINKKPIIITFSNNEIKGRKKYLFNKLIKHLKLVNIFIKISDNKELASEFIIHILNENELNLQPIKGELFFLIDDNVNIKKNSHKNYFDFTKFANYYLSTINLIEEIIHNPLLQEYFREFKDEYQKIQSTFNINNLEILKTENNVSKVKTLKKSESFFFINLLYTLVILTFLIAVIYPIFTNIYIGPFNKQNVIRSALILPNEAILLKRENIQKEIHEKLSPNKGIKIIALVGIGGAGKTTLARDYARSSNSSIVWEINAESELCMLNTFEQLVYSLCRTEEDKQELMSFKKLTVSDERRDKLFLLLAKLLKPHPDWLITYDNVESFESIRKYLLLDPNVWGNGKIIITTRNSHIASNSYVDSNNVIFIKELQDDEKFTFFTQIMGKNIIHYPILQTKEFLKEIPSFPLDVLIAAYYIKSEKISLEKYLEFINKNDESFNEVQEEILKNADSYDNTRYKIITLSIKKILDENPEFQELLLLTSMLDSQYIPKDLLIENKNEILTNQFIHNLKKFSLITENTFHSQNSIPTISIHRSTQAITLAYFTKQLKDINQQLMLSASKTLEKYLKQKIEFHDILQMKLLTTHADIFLSNTAKINKNLKVQEVIKDILVRYYYYIGEIKKVKALLKKDIINYQQKNFKENINITEKFIHLGNIYRMLGKYEKAKILLEESLKKCEQHHKEANESLGTNLIYLGHTYINLGNHKTAINILKRAFDMYKKFKGEDSARTAWSSVYLGSAFRDIGNYKAAQEFLELGWKINKNYYGEENLATAWAMVRLGVLYETIGNYELAGPLLEKGWEIHRKIFGERNTRTAWASLHLGSFYLTTGEKEKALKLIKLGTHHYEKYYGKEHSRAARAFILLANAYASLKEYNKAKELLQKSIIIDENFYGLNHIWTALANLDLGQVELQEKNIKNAEALINKAWKILEENNHPYVYICLESMADLYLQKQETASDPKIKDLSHAKKCEYLLQAEKTIKSIFANDSAHIERINNKLKLNSCSSF